MSNPTNSGILLVDKPAGKTSFFLVRQLRRLTGERKIGHAGTLDPFATGVMVMLIGRAYTRLSDTFINQDKEYEACIRLGEATDSYDCDGQVIHTSNVVPSTEEVVAALAEFQGWVEQVPPMFSAKKVAGKKLYQLARQGKEVERQAVKVNMQIELLDYSYPNLRLKVRCSKGTYIRSLADDFGKRLGCYGHLIELKRSRIGQFALEHCLDGALLQEPSLNLKPYLIRQTA